jgi:hypothetical protein
MRYRDHSEHHSAVYQRASLSAFITHVVEATDSPRNRSLSVLLVTNLFPPVDNLAVECFLNCDVRHGRGRDGPMPMLLAGWEPDHITAPDLFDLSAFALRPAAASRHDEGLTERMRMPRGPRTGLESYAGPLHKCGIWRLK